MHCQICNKVEKPIFPAPGGIISHKSLTKKLDPLSPSYPSLLPPSSLSPKTSQSTLLPSLTTPSTTAPRSPSTFTISPTLKHGTRPIFHAPSLSVPFHSAFPNLICVKTSISTLSLFDLSFLNEPLNHKGRDRWSRCRACVLQICIGTGRGCEEGIRWCWTSCGALVPRRGFRSAGSWLGDVLGGVRWEGGSGCRSGERKGMRGSAGLGSPKTGVAVPMVLA